jgi:DNA-binding NtrC family response regulator
MKRNVLLVANSFGDSNAIVAEVARRTGRGLRQADNSRRAFELLMAGLDDIDFIIIDLDPGSISVLEALGCCDTCPPIIVVTGPEELEMTALAHQHGAIARIGKPFCAAKLAALMEEVCSSSAPQCRMSCDLSGRSHNCAGESRHQRQHKEAQPLART